MNEHVELVKKYRQMDRMIVRLIRDDPSLMDIPLQNLKRWMKLDWDEHDHVDPFKVKWMEIIEKQPLDEVLHILESDEPQFEQLQHWHPFKGILKRDVVDSIMKNHAHSLPA